MFFKYKKLVNYIAITIVPTIYTHTLYTKNCVPIFKKATLQQTRVRNVPRVHSYI